MLHSGSLHRLERRVLADPLPDRVRGRAEVVVDGGEPLGAVAVPGHPQLQRVAAARALERAHALVDRPRRAIVEQVRRALREGRVEVALVGHQQRARWRSASTSSCADPRPASAPARRPPSGAGGCRDRSAEAPCAPSTCSQMPRSAQIRPIATRSSKAPTAVEPLVATTATTGARLGVEQPLERGRIHREPLVGRHLDRVRSRRARAATRRAPPSSARARTRTPPPRRRARPAPTRAAAPSRAPRRAR